MEIPYKDPHREAVPKDLKDLFLGVQILLHKDLVHPVKDLHLDLVKEMDLINRILNKIAPLAHKVSHRQDNNKLALPVHSRVVQ